VIADALTRVDDLERRAETEEFLRQIKEEDARNMCF
ncbi:hypothetical protein KIPB_014712, partial [Kipferlia bialata]